MAQKKQTSLRDPEKEAFWRKKLVEWRESGMSQVLFCRREGLNPTMFSTWKSILQKRAAEQESRSLKPKAAPKMVRPSFVKLEVDTESDGKPATPSIPSQFVAKRVEQIEQPLLAAEIVDAGTGHHVRIFNGADRSTLSALIAALATYSSSIEF